MRINVNLPNVSLANPADSTKALGAASPNGTSSLTDKLRHGQPGAGGDQVQISNLAAQLAADPSKLAQLQAAFAAGTYRVSPSQVANSIINSLLVKGR